MSQKILNPEKVCLPVGPYSQGILTQGSGAWLHIAGQIGMTQDGLLGGSFSEQADLAWQNLIHVLNEAGMDSSHLVKVVTYIVDAADVPLLAPVRLQYLQDARPAATLVVVNALARAEWKVEVEAVAFKAN
ncbi:MAG: RidA family protein [Burkholderiaceae bacterium]|nr:RidA family protein [Burkholderiaceae bacterium]